MSQDKTHNEKLTADFRKAIQALGKGDAAAGHQAMDDYDKTAGFSSRPAQGSGESQPKSK